MRQRLLHLGALLGELAQAIVARKRVPLVSVMNEGYLHFTAVGWLVKLLGIMNIDGFINLCALIMTSRVRFEDIVGAFSACGAALDL